nr:MAG TPA: hypothetical protein [Caudoviricetes sp.]
MRCPLNAGAVSFEYSIVSGFILILIFFLKSPEGELTRSLGLAFLCIQEERPPPK